MSGKSGFIELKEEDIISALNTPTLLQVLQVKLPESVQLINIINLKLQRRYATENIESLKLFSWEQIDNEGLLAKNPLGLWSDPNRPIFLVMFICTKYKIGSQKLTKFPQIFCKDDPRPEMMEEFIKLFDWSKYIEFGEIHPNFAPFLETAMNSQGGNHKTYRDWLMYLPEEEFVNFQSQRLPLPGIEVKRLSQPHASIINDHWKYKDETSLIRIQDSIEYFASAGLFIEGKNGSSNESNPRELVSWIVSFSFGTLNSLFTKEEHRRKGYAEMVLREASKQMIDFGMHPFCEVEYSNNGPRKLLEKIGFKQAFVALYFEYEPSIQ